MFSFSADKWSTAGDQTFVSTAAFLIKLQIYFQHTFQLSNISSPSKLLILKKLLLRFQISHLFTTTAATSPPYKLSLQLLSPNFLFFSVSSPLTHQNCPSPKYFPHFPSPLSSSNWVFHCRPHLVCSPELLVPSPLSRPNLHFRLLHKLHNQVCTQTFRQKRNENITFLKPWCACQSYHHWWFINFTIAF